MMLIGLIIFGFALVAGNVIFMLIGALLMIYGYIRE